MSMRFGLLRSFVVVGWLAGGSAAVRAQQPPPSSPSPNSAAAEQDPQQRVVISVDDEKLTAADIEKILDTLPLQSREYYSGPGRHIFPQYLVRMKVLSEEARRQKLDQQTELRRAIEFATESILADAAPPPIQKKNTT